MSKKIQCIYSFPARPATCAQARPPQPAAATFHIVRVSAATPFPLHLKPNFRLFHLCPTTHERLRPSRSESPALLQRRVRVRGYTHRRRRNLQGLQVIPPTLMSPTSNTAQMLAQAGVCRDAVHLEGARPLLPLVARRNQGVVLRVAGGEGDGLDDHAASHSSASNTLLSPPSQYQEQLMVWNAVTCQHEATIPLPIGTHEFKSVVHVCAAHITYHTSCVTFHVSHIARFFVDGVWICSDAHPLTQQQVCLLRQRSPSHPADDSFQRHSPSLLHHPFSPSLLFSSRRITQCMCCPQPGVTHARSYCGLLV